MVKQAAQRLIVFIELTKGCNNVTCPSWGNVCIDNEQKFMSFDTATNIINDITNTLKNKNEFKIIDFWMYGVGDSLDHPYVTEMLKKFYESEMKAFGKFSMAIDSRRSVPIGYWFKYLDKIKIIHKLPETYDWKDAVKRWETIPLPKSHKIISSKITKELWDFWIENGPNSKNKLITELKAVPFHDIVLGSDNPFFTKRQKFIFDEDVPKEVGPYPGVPVRRTMIRWDGSLRRCLISPTNHKTINDLFYGDDSICSTCFPLTGGELVKFYPDKVVVTPSANCVSDGYYQLPDEPINF